jgi:adenosylcobyric acid synthase
VAKGALMILGTGSDVGKSKFCEAILRILSDNGIKAAPFKGQNMSLNSYVCDDNGEIAKAQAAQAEAARGHASCLNNPVLIKPMGNHISELIVMGKSRGEISVKEFYEKKSELYNTVISAFYELSANCDIVIMEGAGSPAEVNLPATDITNLGLAKALNVNAVLICDIEKGGAFASLYGTYALLKDDADYLKGFVINKFRGDITLLGNGPKMIEEAFNTKYLGTLFHQNYLNIANEDSVSLNLNRPPGNSKNIIEVGILMTPFISNFSDFDPLKIEPSVSLRAIYHPSQLESCDLIILPGSKNTVADLNYLKDKGLDLALKKQAEKKKTVVGICGGYQILFEKLTDDYESKTGVTSGLGLLKGCVEFEPDKIVCRVNGRDLLYSTPISGFFMHKGRVKSHEEPLFKLTDGSFEGSVNNNVLGSSIHQLFDNDDFRQKILCVAAKNKDLSFNNMSYKAYLDDITDRFSLMVKRQIDLDRLMEIIFNNQLCS